MSENDIRKIPSLIKLTEESQNFQAFKKVWPLLRPIARILGADLKSIDESFNKLSELTKQVEEMTAIPDKFNDLFSERGWILFDSLELDVAKEAIRIAEEDGVEVADEYLVDHFSPEWVEKRLNWLKYVKGFEQRFELAKLALDDYKAGRFYASILVTMSLIDGWVCELNIIDFHCHGFFSEKSKLVAWDSIAAHPKGLMRLQEVLGKTRMMTRVE